MSNVLELPRTPAGPAVEAPPAPAVPVQPVPTACSLGQAHTGDGRLMIFLAFQTPIGNSVFFLDGESAKRLGAQLQQFGAAGDILLPPTSAV